MHATIALKASLVRDEPQKLALLSLLVTRTVAQMCSGVCVATGLLGFTEQDAMLAQETYAQDPEDSLGAWLTRRVGSYIGLTHRVVRHLASGGMAHVFLAEREPCGSYAAVKLSDLPSGVPDSLLREEGALLSRIRHPNIVALLDRGTTYDGFDYLLLQYVPGVELDEWLRYSGSAVSRGRLLHVLSQLAAALDHLHAQRIVHGDVKPGNIMVDAYGADRVTLVDFGLAFREGRQRERRAYGTPGYLAPEQLRDERCGPAIDRFALAALALELFSARGLLSRARLRQLSEQGKSHVDAIPYLPCAALRQLFTRALHDRPEERFTSARELIGALESVLTRSVPERAA
jgi:serine/threonine protein kinase